MAVCCDAVSDDSQAAAPPARVAPTVLNAMLEAKLSRLDWRRLEAMRRLKAERNLVGFDAFLVVMAQPATAMREVVPVHKRPPGYRYRDKPMPELVETEAGRERIRRCFDRFVAKVLKIKALAAPANEAAMVIAQAAPAAAARIVALADSQIARDDAPGARVNLEAARSILIGSGVTITERGSAGAAVATQVNVAINGHGGAGGGGVSTDPYRVARTMLADPSMRKAFQEIERKARSAADTGRAPEPPAVPRPADGG